MITSISQGAGQNQIVLNLDRQLSPGNRTIITFNPNGANICLGYLPGDVDGDRTSSPSDISAIIDRFNQYQSSGVLSYPLYSVDIDRNNFLILMID